MSIATFGPGQPVPQLLQDILARRGITDPEQIQQFLFPNYERDLHDPWQLTDMLPAVERIQEAIASKQKVAVYGDYDIDGLTATTLLCEVLRDHGLEVVAYIPDRFEEGYGLNQPALEALQAQGVELVITVDCGITSVAEAAWAREQQLDLIITDHHTPAEQIPDAIAVVNPKRADDTYPFKELAGVGVAFKLVQALRQRTGVPAEGQEKWLLDLVALGTVCDVMTLTGENRALVYFGLRVLRQTRRVGLRALAEVAGARVDQLKSYHLGFVLGPRLNAAGRLEHAKHSLELLETADTTRAYTIARELDELNAQRRATQDAIVRAALEQAAESEDAVLVLADPDWSHGVVGIAASKVVEQAGKPVMIAQVLGDSVKGSARSIRGWNIIEAMRAKPELFERFGGHAYAAGFTIQKTNLEALKAHMSEYFASHPPVPQPEKPSDVVADRIDQFDSSIIDLFAFLEPFGNGNPEPVIEVLDPKIESIRTMGNRGQHVRGRMRDGVSGDMAFVAFNAIDKFRLESKTARRVRGYLSLNEFQGITTLQLQVFSIDYE